MKSLAEYKMNKTKKELKEGEVTNPDGSVFRFEGEEPLKKPKDKKSLKDRWKILKADLSNSKSFLDMLGEDKDEAGAGEGAVQNPDDNVGSSVPTGDVQGGASDQPSMADGGQVQPEGQGVAPSIGDELNQQPADTASQQDPEQPPAQDPGQDQAQPQDQEEQPYSDEEAIQTLKDEGYSDSEIAYIVHHHVPAQPTKDELKHAEAVQNLKHQGSKQDQEITHKDDHHGIDVEHKKRMTDLEFEHAKKEKEMRLKFLEQELQAKIEALKSKSKE